MALDNSFFAGVADGLGAPKRLGDQTGTTAGGVYMAKLGDYMFSLETAAFQDLQRKSAFRWAEMKRIGRKAAMQYTGEDAETIEISGVILPTFRGGIGQVGRMRAAAGRGEAMPLVYAFDNVGQYCGLWCIAEVTEGRTIFFKDGVPRRIEFRLSLVAYGEDAGSASIIPQPASLTGAALAAIPGASVPPSILGMSGREMAAIAGVVAQLPGISGTSAAATIRRASGALASIANGGGSVAQVAQSVLNAALLSLPVSVQAIIPPIAISAAGGLARIALSAIGTSQQAAAALPIYEASPTLIKSQALDLSNLMGEHLQDAKVNASSVQSAASALAVMPPTAGVSNLDRLTAAASVNNLNRASNGLMYGLAEAQRMAQHIAGLIDG